MRVIDDATTAKGQMSLQQTAKVVITDIHFVIPLIVLLIGVSLLMKLH